MTERRQERDDAPAVDLVERMRRAAALRDSDTLTEAEYVRVRAAVAAADRRRDASPASSA